ncbi:16S rRNA (guanine(966)-N(2))-methyltransferase RsmD [Curvibacter sp. PAE-UM]|uniref:16S rRNA (guanine(966)-N(2))-methyltransferase RsmD n=1 Tax=Curvibacter sp. PAE-UM TaxID=1714344 RepID=UPI00070DBFF3|nr:16S rRNA (guanine(966)-N(2))-methyltransferase RsmD [Curvibacter sp. PAE-UM]KRH99653.1 16S rRNA (guanine(966)-N(2))-methyltransferase RsmD [Curvibacter sp. PAE-UM]
MRAASKTAAPSARAATAKSPAAKKTAGRPLTGQPAGEVRIIGGQWKRSKLPVADKPGLRPTPDRVRETLFNWLGQDLTGWRCLDVFAGTGALGFEAASRGAKEVTLVEQDSTLVAQLRKSKEQLQAGAVQVQRGEGIAALKAWPAASADLVFLDPPFDANLFEPALQAAARALAPEGYIYLEAPSAWNEEQLAPLGLTLYRHLKAGAVHAHLLQRS